MTPQKQVNLNFQEGDCLAACVASLLDLPLAEVPNFCAHDDWQKVYRDWLRARGLAEVTLKWDPEYIRENLPLAFIIVAGPAPKRPSELHACIYRGVAPYFDPYPYKGPVDLFFGERQPDHFSILFPLNPAVGMRGQA